MHPCFRHTPGRKRRRRSHHALRAEHSVRCPNCQAAKQPHRACPGCGYVRPGLLIKTGAPE